MKLFKIIIDKGYTSLDYPVIELPNQEARDNLLFLGTKSSPDSNSEHPWENNRELTSLNRAKGQADQLNHSYQELILDQITRYKLRLITSWVAQNFGMDILPPLSG